MKIAAHHDLVERIDAALPQMHCRRCGYDGCRPYAEAIASGDAINRCQPGGDEVIATLAALTAKSVVSLDPSHGACEPLHVALIDESRCIGCTLCIKACPVDAIIGAARQMHTVITAFCTGCDLCIPPCPVDCIEIRRAGRAWSAEDASAARSRYAARSARVAHRSREDASRPGESRATTETLSVDNAARQRRAQDVAAARARARQRRTQMLAKIHSN